MTGPAQDIGSVNDRTDNPGNQRRFLPTSDRTVEVYERPAACPKEGQIEPFDAGWNAHQIGLSRETVRVLAADPGWALLGWDSRELVAARGAPS